MCKASSILTTHSLMNCTPAVLGLPCAELVADGKFADNMEAHVHAGELLAQASLQTELLVCEVAGVVPSLYIGRSQYPRFIDKPTSYKLRQMISSRPQRPTCGEH